MILFVKTFGNVGSYTYDEIASQIIITTPLFIEPYGIINENNQLLFPITINIDGAPSPLTVTIDKIIFEDSSKIIGWNGTQLLGGFFISIGTISILIVTILFFLHESNINIKKHKKDNI